jgi:hypothetical protein
MKLPSLCASRARATPAIAFTISRIGISSSGRSTQGLTPTAIELRESMFSDGATVALAG